MRVYNGIMLPRPVRTQTHSRPHVRAQLVGICVDSPLSACRPGTIPGVGKTATALVEVPATGRANQPQTRRLGEAIAEAVANRRPILSPSDPYDELQRLLDQAVADMEYAQAKVDLLPVDEVWLELKRGGKVLNHWIRLRDEKFEYIERVCNAMIRNGQADRKIQIQTAQAAMMVQAIRRAAERAGIESDQIALLGAELRNEMAQLNAA